MVKFVGGPSVGGYKSYINHTTAREGQWRMPRNYSRPNVNIKVRNYNTCCHQSSVNTGFQLPAWLQWFQFGANLLQSFIPAPKTETPEAPATNSNDQTLKDLQKQIDDLKKENEALKKKPAPVETPVEEPKVEVDNTVKDAGEIKFNTITLGEQAEEPDKVLTTEVGVPKGKKKTNGDVDYYGWNTLTNAYGVPNTKEFRNWFRQKYLNGDDVWKAGTQNFPTEINYPEGSDTKYEFNKGKFLEKPLDTHHPTNKGSGVKEGNTQKQVKKGHAAQAGYTTHGGSYTGTVNGKTYTVRSDGQKDQTAVREDMSKQLQNKGLTKEQADNAVKNAKITTQKNK